MESFSFLPAVSTKEIITRSLPETQQLGQKIGARLTPGTVVALTGDLGSGKTSLVQGLGKGLEVPADYYITSPSYTLVNEYPGRHTLFHVDLYRLYGPDDFEDIGLHEILSGNGVVVIEWADRLENELPSEHISMHLLVLGGKSRKISIAAHGHAAVNMIKSLNNSR